jgi:hypothetical protein
MNDPKRVTYLPFRVLLSLGRSDALSFRSALTSDTPPHDSRVVWDCSEISVCIDGCAVMNTLMCIVR